MNDKQVPITTNENKTIKFTEEEIKTLVDLRDRYQSIITSLGQLYIERMGLNDRASQLNDLEKSLQNQYIDTQKEEDTILKGITEKYGVGSLDISTGTFIPQK